MSSYEERLKKRREKYSDPQSTKNSESVKGSESGKKQQVSTAAPAGSSKYDERLVSRSAKYSDKAVDDSFINTFISDSKKHMDSQESDRAKMGIQTGSSIYESRKKAAADLRKRSFAISRYLDEHKDSMDSESYESLKSYLDEFDRYSARSQYSFYKDHQTSLRHSDYQKKYAGKSYDDLQAALAKMEDGEEKSWLRSYQQKATSKETADALGAADFRDYSRYASTKEDGLWEKMWSQYGMGYGDLTYEYINNQDDIRSEISRKSATYRADAMDSRSPFERGHYDYMTDDEVSAYNYYYAKDGKKRAEEYLDSISHILEARANYQTVQDVSKTAAEHPVLSSIASVGTSLGSGFEYIGDVLTYGAEKLQGRDTHLGTNEAALMTNAVRGTVSEKVDWEIGNWDAFDFLYSTAMSGVDSIAATAFGGWGGAVLGLSAAAQGTNDALDRGMSDGQAFWNGLVSGTFEALFESISIGNFQKLKEVAPNSVKDIIKNLGKSMLVNASEETLTELANITYDTLINGEFANYTWGELKDGAWKNFFPKYTPSVHLT